MAQQSSGFDMSKLSTASKILLGGGILLLLDSFILPWQKVCISFAGIGGCGTASMWGGTAGWAGVIAGLVTLVLIVWEAIALAGTDLNVGIPASKLSAYLGFGVLVFTVLKFLLIISKSSSFGAYIGLVFALAIGYGAWMRFQEPAASAPPAAGTGGGGFTS